MRKIIIGVTTAALLFTGCDLFKDDGILNVQTMNNISIYVDGEFKTDAGENTKLILKEGTHKIKLQGISKDGDWEYRAEQDVIVSGKVEKTVTIYPTKYPSEQKNKKDEQERLSQEKKEQELLVKANEKGCKTYKDYLLAVSSSNKISQINQKLDVAKKNKEQYTSDKGFVMIPNEFIEFQSFSLDKKNKTITLNVKNNSNAELTFFRTKFYFLDEEYNLLGDYKRFQQQISVKTGSLKSFKFELPDSYDEKDLERRILMAKNINLVLKIEDLTLKDNYGELEKDYSREYNTEYSSLMNGDLIARSIKTFSSQELGKLNQEKRELEDSIPQLCSKMND